MNLPFPTRPIVRKGQRLGLPVEADPCPCEDRRVICDETCLMCGHYPPRTIRATWARRAAEVAATPARAAA